MATKIFVFGSNKAGIHGAGAARTARMSYQAQPGVGKGRTGDAYAIPTKASPTHEKRQLPLAEIAGYVEEFREYAKAHPECVFEVTAIGCGLAGYRKREIGPMFRGCPDNVVFLDEVFARMAKKAAWVRCPDCDDYWCRIHAAHVYDCTCPAIDEWGDESPYLDVGE